MASVATGWSFPEDSMSCGICLQPFKLPKILPCGHTFCEECLVEAARGGLRCPTCRNVVPIKGGVAALPNNYQVAEMCQKFSELAAARDATQQWDAACKNHPTEKLRLFCQTCEEPVCNECLDDSAHRGHKNVITVKQAVEERMATVTPLLKEKKRQMEEHREYLEKLTDLEEQVNEVKSQDEQAITDLYEEMARLLSENKEERLAIIRDRYENNMTIINERKSEVQQQLQENDNVYKDVEQAIENTGIAFLSDEPEELRKLAQICVDPLLVPLKVTAIVFRPGVMNRGQLTIGSLGTQEFSIDTPWKTGPQLERRARMEETKKKTRRPLSLSWRPKHLKQLLNDSFLSSK
ncbi:E3 ubiquitin-protein ligase TRIM17-like [Branchiostoma floridae]|uniref:E3 ubiquitin-protein ligase TRIM17-like n=2 Tax=Branchiostoma floridae TaxID=7739 RepID=A0A9J7LAU3_BRAFL|nr:E3 ubiquitin-protein ligase TRIM17-like [Branchiostoma floridae]